MPIRAALFDLDNTLAEPFQPISNTMAESFSRLAPLVPLSVMSAASLQRIEEEVISKLPSSVELERVTLFTANAGQCFTYDNGSWRSKYAFEFSDKEIAQMRTAIEKSIGETGVMTDTQIYGEQYIDYKGYFAFTSLGIGAPSEARKAWDPDRSKRERLRAVVQQKLPAFDVYIGGSTSIDITRKGINKSFGIHWLSDHLHLPTKEMLYVGDALYPGGNDHVVIATGVQTKQTSGPDETLHVIDDLLSSLAAHLVHG